MEAVRKLDYKQEFKVCEAFYQMMVGEGLSDDDSMMCERFRESFSLIDPSLDESSFVPLHRAVNDMNIAIYEIEICIITADGNDKTNIQRK